MAAHAHWWGPKWTTDRGMGIWSLFAKQHRTLFDCCTTQDINPLMEGEEFKQIRAGMTEYLKKGPAHIRLSTVSPKDASVKNGRNPLRVTTVEKVFESLVMGFRVMEELDEGNLSLIVYALILTPWNDRIRKDNEYRCLIYDGQYQCTIKETKEMKRKMITPEDPEDRILRAYVATHSADFPEPNVALDVAVDMSIMNTKNIVIFIEFNTLDEELDLFGVTKDQLTHCNPKMLDMLHINPTDVILPQSPELHVTYHGFNESTTNIMVVHESPRSPQSSLVVEEIM